MDLLPDFCEYRTEPYSPEYKTTDSDDTDREPVKREVHSKKEKE